MKLEGVMAPTVGEIKEWLRAHPAFEIMKPSVLPTSKFYGTKANSGTKEVIKVQSEQKKLQIKRAFSNSSELEPVAKRALQIQPEISLKKNTPPEVKEKLVRVQSAVQKTTPTLATKVTVVKSVEVKSVQRKKKPDVPITAAPVVKKERESSSGGVKQLEPVRLNVRKMFKEVLLKRLDEDQGEKIDLPTKDEHATVLAVEIEQELYNLFSDVGSKYKSKYRSLLFNVKDPKNTLFKRIYEKSLKAYDLVRLTAEELAPAELAQWRKQEAAHEIDLIKKSEMEALKAAKAAVVMKTHKGELEIEARSKELESITATELQSMEVEKSVKKLTPLFKSKEEKDRKKEKERGKEDRRHKSSSRRHRSDKCKDRKREDDRKHDSEKNKGRKENKKRDKDHSDDKCPRGKSSHDKIKENVRVVEKNNEQLPSVGDKTEVEELDEYVPQFVSPNVYTGLSPYPVVPPYLPVSPTYPEVPGYEIAPVVDTSAADSEPSSTVCIKTPPQAPPYAWKGMVCMPDVAKFHAIMKEVSGPCDEVSTIVPKSLSVVGRIEPHMVWDYIPRVSKTKDVLLLRFEVENDEEKVDYLSLYSYLHAKNRIGVVRTRDLPEVKDFYVLALPSHAPLPDSLLPLDGPGLEDYRPHMLLGIIVCNKMTRRSVHASQSHAPPVNSRVVEKIVDSYTPPHSPVSIPVPPVKVSTTKESEPMKNKKGEPPPEDVPYSPGCVILDDENVNQDLENAITDTKKNIEIKEDEEDEVYSPGRLYNNEEEINLPPDLQKLFNFNSNTEVDSSKPIVKSQSCSIAADPIVQAFLEQKPISPLEADEKQVQKTNTPPRSYTPPPLPATKMEPSEPQLQPQPQSQLQSEQAKIVAKLNRDPRKRPDDIPDPSRFQSVLPVAPPIMPHIPPMMMASLPPPSAAPYEEPPPPGMEEEFGLPSSVSNEIQPSTASYPPIPYYAPPYGLMPQMFIPPIYPTQYPVYPATTATPSTPLIQESKSERKKRKLKEARDAAHRKKIKENEIDVDSIRLPDEPVKLASNDSLKVENERGKSKSKSRTPNRSSSRTKSRSSSRKRRRSSKSSSRSRRRSSSSASPRRSRSSSRSHRRSRSPRYRRHRSRSRSGNRYRRSSYSYSYKGSSRYHSNYNRNYSNNRGDRYHSSRYSDQNRYPKPRQEEEVGKK